MMGMLKELENIKRNEMRVAGSDTPWHNQNEAQLSSDPLQGGERVSKYISKLVFYAQPLRLYQGKLAREGTRLTVVSTEEEDLQISLG